MKAVVQHAYGQPADVLHLREIDRPVPNAGEVLVRVRASGVHPDIWHVVRGWPYVLRVLGAGVRKPKNAVPGTDVAGIVESVGPGVTRFKPGDSVFGATVIMQWANGGTYAEYVIAREDLLVHKPSNVSFEQAACVVSPGMIALMNLHPERIKPNDRILVNGAAGNLGSLFSQIARARGAHVTGVDATAKQDSLRALGLARVVDYTREDISRLGERYDLVFDVASTLTPAQYEPLLTPEGIYWMIGHDHFGTATGAVLGSLPRMVRFMLRALSKGHMGKGVRRLATPLEGLDMLRAHLESGALTPLIGRTFPLDAVPAALLSMEEGTVMGRIAISMPDA